MKLIHKMLNDYIKEYFESKPELIPNTLIYDDLAIYLELCFKENERLSAYIKVYTVLDNDVYLHITDYTPFAGLIAYTVEDNYSIGVPCKHVEFWHFYRKSFINLYLQDYDFPIFPKENSKEVEIYTVVRNNAQLKLCFSNIKFICSFRKYEDAENYIEEQNLYDKEHKEWDLKCRQETEAIVQLSEDILSCDKLYLDLVLEEITESVSEINISYRFKLIEILNNEYLYLDTNLRGGKVRALDPDTSLKTIFEDYVNQYKAENPFIPQHEKSVYDYRIESTILT